MIRELKPIEKLSGELSVPGSKYVANRLLMIAAMAQGKSLIKNIPFNDDIRHALQALSQLGVDQRRVKNDLYFNGCAGHFPAGKVEIDVGESGTLMRFITALASLHPNITIISGSQRIQQRPVGILLRSLQELGIKGRAWQDEYPPVVIDSGKLQGGATTIDGCISSQFISALLLIAPYARQPVKINLSSELVSRRYVDLTIALMETFGVSVKREGYRHFYVDNQKQYQAREFTISGDWSSANYFLAGAALTGGQIKVNNLDPQSQQGEARFGEVLERMGCQVQSTPRALKLTSAGPLQGVEVAMGDMPDAVQTLAVLAPFARGTTRITNIAHLKYKECDRIQATAQELRKLGASVTVTDDALAIEGDTTLQGGQVATYNDHRMAMSFALIGLRIPGIGIQDPDCVNKSYPGFWEQLKQLGVKIQDV